MSSPLSLFLVLLLSLVLHSSSDCGGLAGGGETKKRQICPNALTADIITDPNANTLNVLISNSLEDIATKSLLIPSTGVPELMDYFVGCALNDDDTWSMFYNGTKYTYSGGLGLAPSVLTTPLSSQEQQWVSACIMARINYFGQQVFISLRGNPITTTAEEESQYTVFEGSFFGNIFAETQLKFACQGVPRAEALLESSDRALRVCTDGEAFCQYTIVGSCSEVCSSDVGPCMANGTVYNDVIAVFLEGNNGNGAVLGSPNGGIITLPSVGIALLVLISILFSFM